MQYLLGTNVIEIAELSPFLIIPHHAHSALINIDMRSI